MFASRQGFTIVELLIVVVVIGILSTITAATYSGIQDRAKYSNVQANLNSINESLLLYEVKHGSFPVTGTLAAPNWRYSCYHASLNDFIPGILGVAPNLPQAPCKGASNSDDTWLYGSDGAGYKLIHIRPNFTQAIQNSIPTNMRDTRWSYTGGSWGYWTSDWADK